MGEKEIERLTDKDADNPAQIFIRLQIYLNVTWKLSCSATEHIHHKNESINAVGGNNYFLL
jgi:hypothetical protein